MPRRARAPLPATDVPDPAPCDLVDPERRTGTFAAPTAVGLSGGSPNTSLHSPILFLYELATSRSSLAFFHSLPSALRFSCLCAKLFLWGASPCSIRTLLSSVSVGNTLQTTGRLPLWITTTSSAGIVSTLEIGTSSLEATSLAVSSLFVLPMYTAVSQLSHIIEAPTSPYIAASWRLLCIRRDTETPADLMTEIVPGKLSILAPTAKSSQITWTGTGTA